MDMALATSNLGSNDYNLIPSQSVHADVKTRKTCLNDRLYLSPGVFIPERTGDCLAFVLRRNRAPSPSPPPFFESVVAKSAGTKSASFPESPPRNWRFCTVRSCEKTLIGSRSIFRRGWRGKPSCPFPSCEAGGVGFSKSVQAISPNFVSSCLSTFSSAARSCSMVSGWSASAKRR